MELLLQQDELSLDEIDIWNYLIGWTFAQNPTIEPDPSKWTKNDIEIMRKTMNNLIPLIKFQNITPKDYFDKMSPYERLLSEKSISEIFQNSKVNSSELDSSIIVAQKDLYPLLFLN